MAFTYRPTDSAKRAIEKIKTNHSYLKTNSKAVSYAVEHFSDTEGRLRKAESEIFRLECGLQGMKDTIRKKAECDSKYNEMVSKILVPE